jgi:sulfate adenylyltransferase subunit 2
MEYRDRRADEVGARVVVASVERAIATGRLAESRDPAGRNRLQTPVLLEAIEEYGFDALFGGARRDEEKARAKERFLSFRDEFGQWDPKSQRPELWDLYNARIHHGEHIRVFPLSNWTELDVWQYIEREGVALPSIYFAHRREVVDRAGMLLAVGEFVQPKPGEAVATELVRFRTVGDMSCTGAVLSSAESVAEVIREIAATRITERGATRADDRTSEAAMEDRKREGYF